MKNLKRNLITLSLLFFTACGTEQSEPPIKPALGFDMWDYMTSSRNYEVTYDHYEDNQTADVYVEMHRQLGGKEYRKESSNNLSTLTLYSNRIEMEEPNDKITVVRFVHLDDTHVFKSSTLEDCTLKAFHETYKRRNLTFHNVLQVNCLSKEGAKQEFYYGYNEGVVALYKEENGVTTEYVKIGEKSLD